MVVELADAERPFISFLGTFGAGAVTVTEGMVGFRGGSAEADAPESRFFDLSFSNASLKPAKDREVSNDMPSRLFVLKLSLEGRADSGIGTGSDTDRLLSAMGGWDISAAEDDSEAIAEERMGLETTLAVGRARGPEPREAG